MLRVSRVMIDGESTYIICIMSELQKLKNNNTGNQISLFDVLIC